MSAVPLSVELMDLAQFFESCARGGAAMDAQSAAGFAGELADLSTRAKALETGAPGDAIVSGPADIEPVDHDLSRAIAAMADFFAGQRNKEAILTPDALGALEKMLRGHQESARKLEAYCLALEQRAAELERRLAGKTVEHERAVALGIKDVSVIDLATHKATRALPYADIGDAS